MRYIPLLDNPPDAAWLARADALTQSLLNAPDMDTRKAIIDANSRIWGEIKDHLLALSNQKCWYSEAKETYSHYHVDHFRPKKRALDLEGVDQGGYWWLAFDWKNYRISGSVGNTKKGDRFSVLNHKANLPTDPLEDEMIYFLDPIDTDDPALLTFDENGVIKPINPNEEDWDHKRAEYTIENLNLNFGPLSEARKLVWNQCVRLIDEIKELLIDYNHAPSTVKKERIKSKQRELLEKTNKSSEFSATAIACLAGSGIEWAQHMAHRNGEIA